MFSQTWRMNALNATRLWLNRSQNSESCWPPRQSELESEMARLYNQLQHARSELTIQRGSIDALKSGEVLEPATTRPMPIEPHQLEALYVALEDRFRGSRDGDQGTLSKLSALRERAAPVIDLGCGRGEWLEILE